MSGEKQVTASNSHAAMISELADMRRHLWTLIAEVKKIAHHVPNRERVSLLTAATEAERKLF